MKKLILFTLIIGSAFSCKDFEDWNVDAKNPNKVPASFLMTSAQRTIFLRMTSPNVNYNIFKMLAQHWTATTYADEANYDLRGRDVSGGFWTYMYRDVLADLKESKRIINATTVLAPEQPIVENKLAIVELLEVYTWHVLVDTYGDIPYTEALLVNENLTPVYDDDVTIYSDLFARIDVALTKISDDMGSFGAADLIYGGDMEKWTKFGNSLKLRMAVRISDHDAAKAKIQAQAAISAGVFESVADNAAFPFEGGPPNANPIWSAIVESGRSDIVVANTFVDIISPLNDPRSEYFMDDNKVPYIGGPYAANNTFSDYTHLGGAFHNADFEAIIISYEEVLFLLAEAVERNLIAGDAEKHYKDAITASFDYWVGNTDAIDAYIAQPSVAYDAANWKKSIGVQKWIALFGKGFEAWSSWRMLDYPEMNTADDSELPVPRRYLYGNDDAQINGENYKKASEAMGEDELSSRVFWDIKGIGN